jgi:hypothetical protein
MRKTKKQLQNLAYQRARYKRRKEQGLVCLNVWIDKSIVTALKHKATRSGMTLTDLVKDALQ